MTTGTDKALRADAERTSQQILQAAQRVLTADPTATMADIAKAAGVARTTVHRRFDTREALVRAMSVWSARRVHDAIDTAYADSAPPLIALYRVTAQILQAKTATPEMVHHVTPDPETARIQSMMATKCVGMLRRAQESGVLRSGVDLVWAKRVYYALIHEAIEDDESDVDVLATRVVDTLLRGLGGSTGL